ncbi:hypothetical protein BDW59DRAFT_160221 [Aspergillus cavernicola]|uniref:Translationally-controlled tumor protein homolog n=1 Tax=Aspergillus cavernicola TaxID=176166 RepID=A0ABR4ILC5_9EURO
MVVAYVNSSSLLFPSEEMRPARKIQGYVISKVAVLADTFPIKDVDDIVYEVDCKIVEQHFGMFPATLNEENPKVLVNNLVDGFALVEMTLNRKLHLEHL